MGKRLKDNINSQWVTAANAMQGKNGRRRIVAYVESYDDIYFWRTVLSDFENDQRYFEVLLPSKVRTSRESLLQIPRQADVSVRQKPSAVQPLPKLFSPLRQNKKLMPLSRKRK